MSKALPVVSLVLSLLALAASLLMYFKADTIADAAVTRRERAMVEKLKPKMVQIFADFNTTSDVSKATTLDELFAPLFKLATTIQ